MTTIARNEDLLHLKEAARLLDVHPSSIRRAIRSGELEALKLGTNGHYRIRRQALDEFLRPTRGRDA
jgi:excisionase family DNA binding protein